MLDFIKECNKYGGRWNRKKFWLYPLGFMIILIIVVLLLWLILSKTLGELGSQISLGILIIGYIYLIYISFVSYIKRLHDLDKTGWMSLLLFIPFANLYLFIICGFFVGTTGKNQYGEDQLGGTTPATAEANSTPNEL